MAADSCACMRALAGEAEAQGMPSRAHAQPPRAAGLVSVGGSSLSGTSRQAGVSSHASVIAMRGRTCRSEMPRKDIFN